MAQIWSACLFLQCLMLCSGEDRPWTDLEQLNISTQPELSYGAFPNGDRRQRNPRMKSRGHPRGSDGYRFQDTSCLNKPRFSTTSLAAMLMELLKNREGTEHATVARFLQATNRAGLNPDQFEEKEGEMPEKIEDLNTYTKLVVVMWLAANDQLSLEKTGWCALDQISRHVSSSNAAQVARVLDNVLPTLSTGRQILENFSLSLRPRGLQWRTSTLNSRIIVKPPNSSNGAAFDNSMAMNTDQIPFAVETMTSAVEEMTLSEKNMSQDVRILMDGFISEFERRTKVMREGGGVTEGGVSHFFHETVLGGTGKDGTVNDGKVRGGIVKDLPIIMKDEILTAETMKEADGIVKTKPVKKETNKDNWSQPELLGLTQYKNRSPRNIYRPLFLLHHVVFFSLYFWWPYCYV